MSDIHAAAKRAAKAAKLGMVSSVCSQLDKAQTSNNDCIPHGMIANLLKRTNELAPNFNITRHDIRNHFKR